MTSTPEILKLCERLEKLYAGVVSDGLTKLFDRQVDEDRHCNRVVNLDNLDYTTPGKIICGPAFNTWGRFVKSEQEAKELDPIRIEMLEHVPEGSVQVLDIGIGLPSNYGWEVAHFGDITAITLSDAGCKGTITNGRTRDVDLIVNLNYSLIHKGVSPVDAVGHWMSSGYGDRTLQFFNISVAPGDILHVSSDGIIIIHEDELEEVCHYAEEIAGKESSVRRDLTNYSPMDVYNKHGRW